MQVHGTLLQLQQLVTAATQVLEIAPDWLRLLPNCLLTSSHLLVPHSGACPAVRSAFLTLSTSLETARLGSASQQLCGSEAQGLDDDKESGDANSDRRDGRASHNRCQDPADAAAPADLRKMVQQAAYAALQAPERIAPFRSSIDPGSRASTESSMQATDQALQRASQLPCQANWLKQATKALLEAPVKSQEQAILSAELLQHPVSEVRAAAAKALVTRAAQGRVIPPLQCDLLSQLYYQRVADLSLSIHNMPAQHMSYRSHVSALSANCSVNACEQGKFLDDPDAILTKFPVAMLAVKGRYAVADRQQSRRVQCQSRNPAGAAPHTGADPALHASRDQSQSAAPPPVACRVGTHLWPSPVDWRLPLQ